MKTKINKFIYSKVFIQPFFLSLLILFFISLPGITTAYTETTSGGSLVATVRPSSPAPNENITINLAGYGYKIDQADIIWYLNDTEVQKGTGLKSYTFTNGDLGETSVITILLRTKEGRVIAKNMTFIGAEVDLLWQANTYTPNFYSGASLPTSGSMVTVTAIPQIKNITTGEIVPSNDLIFTWKKDYKNLVADSGVGKNSISFRTGLFPNSHNVEVTVSSANSSIEAYKKITIPIYEPELIIYPHKPLTGPVTTKTIGNSYTTNDNEESFIVEPYFWPNDQLENNGTIFSWQINNEVVSSTISPEDRILNTEIGGSGGSANINIRVSSLLNRFLQNQKSFTIELDNAFNLF